MPPKNALTKAPQKFLTVEIDGKNYNIPTLNSLKVKEVKAIMKLQKGSREDQYIFMTDFFGKYLGEEIVDDMVSDDLNALINLWYSASEQTANSDDVLGDPSMGES